MHLYVDIMSDSLNDIVNLSILEKICSGVGVQVNINYLAKTLKRHRKTIKNQVNSLFEHNIINKPVYPFLGLYQEYPLMVVAQAELPRVPEIAEFLNNDEHIFAAFYVKDEVYNTLMIEYHENLHSYGQWRKRIVADRIIPPREMRYPANVSLFSNKDIIKYQPHSPILSIEEKFKNGHDIEINGLKINELCIQILKKIMMGEGIRTNESKLSAELSIHRKTIERKIKLLQEYGFIGKPVCRFPKFFVPPEHILIYALVEVKKSKDRIIRAIKSDPTVPLAIEAEIGRYNLLLFKVFSNVEEHFEWDERYEERFPDCIGAMKFIFLSPKMTASIDQQKVSLGIIQKRKDTLHGKDIIRTLETPRILG